MIREISYEYEISGVNSPLLARIGTAFHYKTQSDNAWLQKNSLNETISVLSSVDKNFTLITTNKTDFDELNEFLKFNSFNSIVSKQSLKGKINDIDEKSFSLMKLENDFGEISGDVLQLSKASSMSDYEKIYNLVFPEGNGDFSRWYCDLSKKICNGDAYAVFIKSDEETVSCAVAPVIFNSIAIISGVFTSAQYRKQGLAAKCVESLSVILKESGVNDIYLWCEDSLVNFYKKTGFTIVGNIFLGMVK